MSPFISLAIFALVVVIMFFVVRYVVKLKFPNMGRISASIIIAASTVLDQLNVLPWEKILDDVKVQVIGFSIAAGMALLHAVEKLKGDK